MNKVIKYKDLFEEFGTIVFLEGGSDAFCEYNETNYILKSCYDKYDFPYIIYENIYKMETEEVKTMVKSILELSNSGKASIALYTTNTKYMAIEALKNITVEIIKNSKFNIDNMVYVIEQYNHTFEDLSGLLKAKHTDISHLTNEDDSLKLIDGMNA